MTHRTPGILGPDTDLVLSVFVQNDIRSTNDFRFDRNGIQSTVRKKFGEYLSGSVGWTLYRERVFDSEKDLIIADGDLGRTRYGIGSVSAEYDRRDDQFNPRKGYFTSLQFRLASEWLGSEAEFGGGALQMSDYRNTRGFACLGK